MESLTDQLTKPTDKPKATERICLGSDEATKAQAWLEQINSFSKGFLALSKSDVINFLIREFKSELTAKEMQKIKFYHYDPIKHLNWITPRLKEALINGDTEKVAEIQEEIRSIELAVIQHADTKIADRHEAMVTPPKTRKKRSKKDMSEAPSNSPESIPIADINDVESAHKIIL
ncbi:MAG: hypothetical protein ACXVCD_15315 [Pseudobdellovibrionaceae bacterium]